MQEQILTDTGAADNAFCVILQQAESGDNDALLEVLNRFQSDMEYLACFIKMPREDSIQEMKAALIELIRRGDIWER